MESKRKESHKSGIRVRWKLFALLLSFVIFMLAVIWLLQIKMLGSFYKNAKYRELKTISGILENCLDTDLLDDVVNSCAIDYVTCIRIFKKNDDKTFIEAASADVTVNCVIHHLTQDKLQKYYQLTLERDGVYSDTQEIRHQIGSFWSGENEHTTKLFEVIRNDEKAYGIVYNRLLTSAGGTEYMIMLNSELTPVNATVKTLKTQFIWISVVLICGAFLLAFFISRNISRPISDMNKAAKQLALGRYDVDFRGYGYREIRELGDSLNYAASELSKLDSLQQELIANVSHDLRTPLTMIHGYSEMIRDIPGENTPENMQVIIDETTHLSDLVTDLLDISKLRAGSRKPTPEFFDLTGTIREVMARYDRLVSADGYEIAFHCDRSVTVYADRMMILQVIYNLINNAINYAGEDKKITVTQVVQNQKVRISVRDNGKGIAPEDICLIWDRYYRVDTVHKRAVVGSGLGLSIVKGILELHKAHYGVESALGHGSTFWFELEIIEPKKENKTGEKYEQ